MKSRNLICALLVAGPSLLTGTAIADVIVDPGKSLFNHYLALSTSDSGKFLYYTSTFIPLGSYLGFPDSLNGTYVDGSNNFSNAITYGDTYQDKKTRIDARGFVTFDPSGKYLFLLNTQRNFVSQFQLDSATKTFIPNANTWNFQLPCQDMSTAYDPFRSLQFIKTSTGAVKAFITCKQTVDTKALYIVEYAFNTATGTLGNPAAPTAPEIPLQPTYGTPDNRNLATVGKRVAEIADPQAILMGRKGQHFYYIDNQRQLQQKDYDPRADLFVASKSPPIIVGEPDFVPESMSFDSPGKHIYVVLYSKTKGSSIYKFNRDAQGNILLPPAGEPHRFDVANPEGKIAHATYIKFAPSNNYAYVLDQENSLIYQYGADSMGALRPLQTPLLNIGLPTYSLVFSPDNKLAYALKYDLTVKVVPRESAPKFLIEKLLVGADGALSVVK